MMDLCLQTHQSDNLLVVFILFTQVSGLGVNRYVVTGQPKVLE